MATYQSFPGVVPGTIASGLKFGNNQLLFSETQPGATPGQFLIATSATTLGWTTISTTTYADGLNSSTPGQPVQTASTTPLAGQYLKAFLPTNAIWDWAYMNGVKIHNDTLVNRSTVVTSDNVSVAIGTAQAIQGVAIGYNAVVTTQGVAIGVATTAANGVSVGNASVCESDGVSLGLNCQGTAQGVAIGSANTVTSGVRVGYLGSATSGVAVGNSAVATTGVAAGTSASATTGVTIGTSASATTGIAIGTSATTTTGIAIGISASASGSGAMTIGTGTSTGLQTMCVGRDNNTTLTGNATAFAAILYGHTNTLTVANNSTATRVILLGANNTVTSTGSGNIDTNIFVGSGNQLSTGSNNADNNYVFGSGNVIVGGTRQAVVIGGFLTNANSNSILMGINSAPLSYRHTSGANFFHTVTTANGTGTTLTAGAIMGGIVTTSLTGPANLQLPSGSSMDSSTAISGSLWIGMAMIWRLQHITNSGVITITDGTSGHTYEGPTLAAAPSSRTMLSVRTAANTWITYG